MYLRDLENGYGGALHVKAVQVWKKEELAVLKIHCTVGHKAYAHTHTNTPTQPHTDTVNILDRFVAKWTPADNSTATVLCCAVLWVCVLYPGWCMHTSIRNFVVCTVLCICDVVQCQQTNKWEEPSLWTDLKAITLHLTTARLTQSSAGWNKPRSVPSKPVLWLNLCWETTTIIKLN